MTITQDRWCMAQEGESDYWKGAVVNSTELLRLVYEKSNFLKKISINSPWAIIPPNGRKGEALEIGVGSIKLGIISFLEPPEAWNLTGVDPLPLTEISKKDIYPYVFTLYQEIYKRPLHFINSPAENLEFDSDSFDLCAYYNVLDHTHNPYAILKQIHRVLRPGGYFLLGLDSLSLANWLRHKFLFLEDKCHPYKFTTWHVEKLLHNHGFEQLFFSSDRYEFYERIIGKARRLTAIGRKPLLPT